MAEVSWLCLAGENRTVSRIYLGIDCDLDDLIEDLKKIREAAVEHFGNYPEDM